MSILKILHFPDHRLRRIAKLVTHVDKHIQYLIDDMSETMYAEQGIGLAATQVDINQRIIVIDVSENRDSLYVMINPEVLEKRGHARIKEGCLSIPNFRDFVSRAEYIKIQALDRDGKKYELESYGLLAICIQHEIDHLDGKLFIDYLSPLKRQRIEKKISKFNFC
ncbi:peptide deformylase [Candidatus Ishikawella capsulata]|nr:peptide deformylase [Candidatus Ishikawaella capsulata]